MVTDPDDELRRKVILGTISSAVGLYSVQSVSGRSAGEDNETNDIEPIQKTYLTELDTTPLGAVDPAVQFPIGNNSLSRNEQHAVREAAASGMATLTGEPTFPIGSIVKVRGSYHQIEINRTGVTETEVPTLEVERLESSDVERAEADPTPSHEKSADGAVQRAIARNRHLEAKAGRESELGRGNQPDGPGRSGTNGNRPHYAFSPNEAVPPGLESKSDGFVVAGDDGHYRVTMVEQQTSVPEFEVTTTEVANNPKSFNEWFADEYVFFDGKRNSLSETEQKLLEASIEENYQEHRPYSDGLQSLLDRIEVLDRSSSISHRFIRLGGELHYVRVTQSVGS